MFLQILSAIREWLGRIELAAEVLTDRADVLRVVFETGNALAELIVEKSDFAPYHCVSFTVLDTRLDVRADPVFCFYDDENSTIPEILRELDLGIEYIAAM